MNYIKWYIGDYMKKTGTLSIAEHGAYCLMLQHYYATEEPLPVERELYHLLRAQSKQEREAVDLVVSRYWQQTDTGLVHGRADEEIRKAASARDKHAECGKKGGRPRKQTETNLVSGSKPNTKPNEKPTNTITNTSPSLRSGEGARATRLPPDWEPNGEDWCWAVNKLESGQRMGLELAKFRDYWAAKAGQGGRKLDWGATWRNWVRRSVEHAEGRRASGASPAKPLSAVERVRQACGLDDDGFPVGPNDGDLRPQMGEQLRPEADGRVVEADFHVVSGRD